MVAQHAWASWARKSGLPQTQPGTGPLVQEGGRRKGGARDVPVWVLLAMSTPDFRLNPANACLSHPQGWSRGDEAAPSSAVTPEPRTQAPGAASPADEASVVVPVAGRQVRVPHWLLLLFQLGRDAGHFLEDV
jgi:hypothetical protein